MMLAFFFDNAKKESDIGAPMNKQKRPVSLKKRDPQGGGEARVCHELIGSGN